jgi:hypothetical protein
MRIFEHRKPATGGEPRDTLATLRQMLARLEAEPVETDQTAELKRLLAGRIAEIESKIGMNPAQ